jgi:hypothetical protein
VSRAGTIVAGAAGAALLSALAAGCGGGGGSSASVDTTPITAPARISAYGKLADLPVLQSAAGKKVLARRLFLDGQTQRAVQKAYGGAAAIATEYSDPSLGLRPLLVAVRASTPRPWFPAEDTVLEKIARPQNEVRHVGDADCVIRNAPTPAGKTPSPQSAVLQYCQRSGPKLTVIVANVQPFTDPTQVVPLVDDAWSQVSK